MSADPLGQNNINAGNITAEHSIVAVGSSITIIVNGRRYTRPFALVPPRPKIFVGREQLLNDIKTALFSGGSLALSALDGKPGVGKTALATVIAWDEEVLARFSGGILWANLGLTPDLDSILLRWATALGVDATKETKTSGRIAAVQIGLNGRNPLIILDDAWDKHSVHRLREAGNPGTAYLLTTRDASIAYDFAPRAAQFDVTELNEEQATELLTQLCPAAAVDQPGLKRVAQAVGYLPLALKLVGGYMADNITLPEEADIVLPKVVRAERWLGLEDIDQRLTLEQVIIRSVDALPHADQLAFAALGAFAAKPANFNAAATLSICAFSASTIGLMVRRNLVEQLTGGRLTIHQTIASVAARHTIAQTMVSSGFSRIINTVRHRTKHLLLAKARDRHARYYLDLMLADSDDWQAIEAEWGQILHAWQWVSSEPAGEELVTPYLEAAGTFMSRRGYWRDYIAWTERGVELAYKHGNQKLVATWLNNLSSLYADLGDRRQALNYYQQALSIHRQVGYRSGEAVTLTGIGKVYSDIGDKQQALNYYKLALPIQRQIDDSSGEANTHNNIGKVYSDLGNKQRAFDYYQQALPIHRQIGYRSGEANTIVNIGEVYSDLGDKQQAFEFYQQALPIRRQVGDRIGEAATLTSIGTVYADLGDWQQAINLYQQALSIHRLVGYRSGEAVTLNNIGGVYATLGDKQRALDFYQQALLIQSQAGDRAGEGVTANNIAVIYYQDGDLTQARSYLEQALTLAEQVQSPALIAAARDGLAEVSRRGGS